MKIQNIARLGGDIVGCDCEDILQRLTVLEEGQCDCEAIDQSLTELDQRVTDSVTSITTINNELVLLKNATEISGVRSYKNSSGLMNGLGASVIGIGPTFNYWGVGMLVGSPTWSATRINLIVPQLPANPDDPLDVGIFPELFWYQGDTTVSTVWFNEGGTPYSMPLYIDASGIYIRPISTLHPSANTTFNFTQTLILTPPITP